MQLRFSERLVIVLAALALGVAAPALANINGSVDTSWGGVEAGRVRVGFDLGSTNYDFLNDARVLADGRLVAIGTTTVNAGDNRIAVAVRKADGTADTAIAPNGRYAIAVTGFVSSVSATGAIAPDGSYYVVGRAPNTLQLRIWHYAINGTELTPPLDVGVPNTRYIPSTAFIDAAGRLLVGGFQQPASATGETLVDGFLLRLVNGGSTLDAGFGGIRTLVFDANQRDDVFDITDVGENYAVCGRVGNLSAPNDLRFGIALFSRSGSLLPSFNGNGQYVDQLALNGGAASSACNAITTVRSNGTTRIVITGRASRPTQFSRAYLLVVGLDGQLVAGTPRMIDFGVPAESTDGFPEILSAPGSDRIFLAGSGTYDASGRSVIAVARMDAFGNYDTSWGDTPSGTKVVMSAPAIGGTQRDLVERRLSIAGGRLHLGANILVDNNGSDFALVRFTGDTIFAAGLD